MGTQRHLQRHAAVHGPAVYWPVNRAPLPGGGPVAAARDLRQLRGVCAGAPCFFHHRQGGLIMKNRVGVQGCLVVVVLVVGLLAFFHLPAALAQEKVVTLKVQASWPSGLTLYENLKMFAA